MGEGALLIEVEDLKQEVKLLHLKLDFVIGLLQHNSKKEAVKKSQP